MHPGWQELREGYWLSNDFIAWATPLSAVRDQLGARNVPDPYAEFNWPACQCPTAQVAGLPAAWAMVRGPHWSRPGLQYHVALAPLAPGKPDPSAWRTLLEQHLGPAPEEYLQADASHAGAGSVVLSLTWPLGPVRLALSVYGGIRNENGYAEAAGLFVDYEDLDALAAPFAAQQATEQQHLNGLLRTAVVMHRARLQQPVRHANLLAPEGPARTAYRVLHHPDMWTTPPDLAAQLDEHTCALWHHADSRQWGLSTYLDTVRFAEGTPVAVEAVQAMPARGPGWVSLRIGALQLSDRHESPALPQLAQAVQAHLPAPITWYETLDA